MQNRDFLIHEHQVPYDSLDWDTMDNELRDNISLSQLIKTALFAKEYIPFYRDHLRNFTEQSLEKIASLEEFALVIPETTKAHMTFNDFNDFTPVLNFSERQEDSGSFRNKGTGGTTGDPVTVLYSSQDWKAMSQHIARSLKFDHKDNLDFFKGLTVVGLYDGDHVTNEIYKAGLISLGAEFYARNSTKNDPLHMYKFIQQVMPNVILGPPGTANSSHTKGINISDILEIAMGDYNAKFPLNNKRNPEFKGMLWSSMDYQTELSWYTSKHLGLEYIQGQYGSTEGCPTGATCKENPKSFHLGYGPTNISVKSLSGKKVSKEKEEGYVLMSKTGGVNSSGLLTVPTGTTLINYRTGDYCKIRNSNGEYCGCERNTPVLYDLKRIENLKAKMLFGCQAD